MTPAPHARARHRSAGEVFEAAADPAGALVAFLHRVDDRLQERALVLGLVHGVDAPELFALTRADLWARREEFAASDEDERLTVTWLLLARHARLLVRRAEGRSVPPVDHAAVDAARALPPAWGHLPGVALLADPETAVFRALRHVGEPARSVLVLHWLGVGADDVADELQLGAEAVTRLRTEARAQLRHVLLSAGSAGGNRR